MRALLTCAVTCLLLVLASSGCTDPADATRLTEIKVTERGSDAAGDFCADFALSDSQASDFFKRAIAIDAARLHEFDMLPCYVRGTARLHGNPATWQVRAGGTAEVDSGATHLLMACSSCDDLLGGKTQ